MWWMKGKKLSFLRKDQQNISKETSLSRLSTQLISMINIHHLLCKDNSYTLYQNWASISFADCWQVLDVAVKGHSTESLSQARQLLAGMIQDSDFAHLRELHSPVGDYKSDRKSGESDSIQCAAKLVSVDRRVCLCVYGIFCVYCVWRLFCLPFSWSTTWWTTCVTSRWGRGRRACPPPYRSTTTWRSWRSMTSNRKSSTPPTSRLRICTMTNKIICWLQYWILHL